MRAPETELYHFALNRLEVALIEVLVEQELNREEYKNPRIQTALLQLSKATNEVTSDLHPIHSS